MSDTTKKETSQRRKDASRANGAKSKGPVTAEGKARSSQNAATHRLLCVNVRTEEDQITVSRMLEGYLARYQPRDQPEYDLVVRAVIATYLLFLCQNRAITLINIQMAQDRHTVDAGWRNATGEDRGGVRRGTTRERTVKVNTAAKDENASGLIAVFTITDRVETVTDPDRRRRRKAHP